MKTILYIISEIDKALEFEWTAEHLKDDFNLHFILLNPTSENPALAQFLASWNIPCNIIAYKNKIEIPKIILSLYHHIKKIKPDIVHTHLLQANMLGLTAAKWAKVPVRIYTRHHSSFNHIYHPKKVWYDHYTNKNATHIVAISPIVQQILIEWEKVNPKKIFLIPHGIDFKTFNHVPSLRVESIKQKYQIETHYPVIGVISRWTEWKGIQYIIPAFQKLLAHYPDALLLLAGKGGEYASVIEKMLKNIPCDNYRVIGFEPDVPALYQSMDVFVHAPIDAHSEAFGQVYIEAMASKIPMVCTISGIAHNLVKDKWNAIVVPYKNSDAIYESMMYLLSHPDLKEQLRQNASQSVKEFSVEKKVFLLKKLYQDIV